ncbi:MAG: hypothetical protein R3F41_07660 [Gammaproteobacteria bacterium]|nr:hypothetical protein [Pseudomonadales bacterium]MCP5349322.1 hypothetical protein [Pseudomonadales bacterium]
MQATQKLCIAGLILTAAPGLLAQQDWLNSFTPDGQPDLQGVWTNPTITPMERPASLADRAYLSDDEVAALEARTAQRRQEADANIEVSDGGDVGAYNQIWLDSGDTVLSTGQTSLVVDPPTGRAPIRESAQQTRDYFFAHVEDHYRYHTVWDRCITRGVPGSMLPAGYNNAYRIIQTPDTVTIVYEMIHDVRIIPLDKSEHIDGRVRLWMGDSVAHWEDQTLVIETTNFNDRGMIASSAAGGRLKGVPVTDDLHVVERFTRTAEDTILWEVTVTDPEIYTRPFTISMPLTRDSEYVMYEYACHEGNHAIANILRAGRAREARETREAGETGDGTARR